jgi:hypothetical protein
VAERADVIVREPGWPGRDQVLSGASVGALLDACEALAVDHHADHVELGMNTGRHEAYAAVMARGYRAGLVGVTTMHRANDEGYSRPGIWLIDDWR